MHSFFMKMINYAKNKTVDKKIKVINFIQLFILSEKSYIDKENKEITT